MALFVVAVTGCGVKGPPVPPDGSKIPSYVDQYLEKEEKKKEK